MGKLTSNSFKTNKFMLNIAGNFTLDDALYVFTNLVEEKKFKTFKLYFY